jgi:hypothetical protein
LLGDWGYDDMLQQPGDAAVAANGDTSRHGIATVPEQQHQQQQQQQSANPDSSVTAEGGLLDLLWDDGAQQQQQQRQQQLEGLDSRSNLQESNGPKSSVQPAAVDSFEDLSLLDTPAVDTLGRAAAAAAAVAGDGDQISGAAKQHSSSNGDVNAGQLQAAEQLVAGAVGPGVAEDSSSSGDAAAQVGLPISGSWDPLNASDAPPAAASVEGILL